SGGTSRSRIEKPPEPGARLHGELVVRDDHAKEIGGAVVDERDVKVGEFEDDDRAVSCTERGPLCRKLSVEGGGELRHEAWVPTRGRRWPLDRHSRRPGEVVTSREIDRRRKRRGRRCRRSELLDRRAEGAGDRDPSLQDTVCEVVVAARCGPISKLERDEDAVVADLDLRSWGGKRTPGRGSRRRGTLIDRRRQDEPHEIVDPRPVGDPAQERAAVLSAHESDANHFAFDVHERATHTSASAEVVDADVFDAVRLHEVDVVVGNRIAARDEQERHREQKAHRLDNAGAGLVFRRPLVTSAAMRLPRIVQPLRHRDFRLLWTGQTLTLLGSFVSYVAY